MFSIDFKKNIKIFSLQELLQLHNIPLIPIQEGKYEFNNFGAYNYSWIHDNENKNTINDQLISIPLYSSCYTSKLIHTQNDIIPKNIFHIKNKILEYNDIQNKDVNNYQNKNTFIVFFLDDNPLLNIDFNKVSFENKTNFGVHYINYVMYECKKIGVVIVSLINNNINFKKITLNIKNNNICGFGFTNNKNVSALNVYTNINTKNLYDNNTIAFIKYSPIEHKQKKINLTTNENTNKFTINNKKFDIIDKNKTEINYRRYFQLLNKNLYKELFGNLSDDNDNSPIIVSLDLFQDIFNIHVIGKARDEFSFRSKDTVKERSSILSQTTNKGTTHVRLSNKNGQFIFIMLFPYSNNTDDYDLYNEFDLSKTTTIYLNFVTFFNKEVQDHMTTFQRYLNNFIKYLMFKDYIVLFNKKTATEHIYILTNKKCLTAVEMYNNNNISTGIKIISN